MTISIQEITQWMITFIQTYQVWAIPIIFLLAFGESLAIVSLFLPATAVLLACGALIGADLLPFFPIWLAATTGAILGDSLSYWIGKHYHRRIIHAWPLNKHPKTVFRAEQFFFKYGILSIFIGRFFGPLRAFVPLIAGAMYMPLLPFNVANISSATIWAFGILAPGTLGMYWLTAFFN